MHFENRLKQRDIVKSELDSQGLKIVSIWSSRVEKLP